MALTPQWLDELRSRTMLSALIGRSIKVTKAGREYKACCPFHNEKTPSFTINDEKGFYHCFGCSAHGDAIRWMTDQRGLSFMDAVKELAAQAGMEVPAPDPRAAQQAEQRAGLHDVMQAAQDWFAAQLNSIEGAAARSYLERRGIHAQTVKDFGFGFAPDSKSALKAALAQFGDDMLVEAGLLIKVDDKAPYDRFRGRLMIPIRDPRGRVIAFGGRILGDGEPKYLNSPDTPLFDKGRTLYNLDKCSPASRSTGRVIVVEGYMDVIALAQAGFPDAVAPLGTALTEQQIEMLWRMTEKPLLCFDGDAAGQKAAMRAADRALPLLRPGHSLQFVTLPEGQDPDDLVKSSGSQAFKQLLDNSEPLVDRLWAAELVAQSLDTPEDRASLKQRLGQHISAISDGEIKRHYADAFRDRFDALFARKTAPSYPARTNPNFKRGSGAKWAKTVYQPTTSEARGISSKGSDLLMQGLLVNILLYPALIDGHREALMEIHPRNANQADLLSFILDSTLTKKSLDSAGLLTILEGQLYNVAQDLLRGDGKAFAFNRRSLSGEADDYTSLSKNMAEMIKLVKQRPALEQALDRATIKVSQELTEENYAEQQRLRSEKEAFDRRIVEMADRGLDI
ncbi:DNA primase [Sphingorhabdus arenilitoris]|uniref:DNA primase n=1 Tax=Sphingorhabdus arenilitoris TaxID=1490041 RepID=A0ABV8RFA4_9SPHN